MEEYKLGDFAAMLSGAIIAHDELRTGDNLKRCSPEGVSVREVCSDEFLRNLAIVMDGLLIMCRNFECDPALAVQMESLKQDLDNGLRDRREGVLAARLGQILEGITENLNSRKFMFISADQAKFYDDPLMFGGAFLVTFSEGTKQAVFEMGEAGRCYACGRWTSCVFHCMRAVEFGLRRLFRIAGARLPIHNQVRYQIEYAEWQAVIDQIKRKIAETRRRSRGARKEKRLQFFSDLAERCEYMKDIWRNEVSHTRRVYTESEALSVILRVKGFMELVSSSPPK